MTLARATLHDEEVRRHLGAILLSLEARKVVHRPLELPDDHGDAIVGFGVQRFDRVLMHGAALGLRVTQGLIRECGAGENTADRSQPEPAITADAEARDEHTDGERDGPRQELVASVALGRRLCVPCGSVRGAERAGMHVMRDGSYAGIHHTHPCTPQRR